MNKLLTESVRETLQAQYPNEDLIEIDGHIYHLPHTQEAWEALRDEVRPGWEVMGETGGLWHYVIYNPECYEKNYINVLECRHLTEDTELPINCSSCFGMFTRKQFSAHFEFPETFDTSEVVDMAEMFRLCTFNGDMSFGKGFKTDKVKDFNSMFFGAHMQGTLDLGPNFNLENAEDLLCMFSGSRIAKPIKFGDKFNPKNALRLEQMFCSMEMPEGFNLGNNFHVRKGASVREMFAETNFNKDFWLPECFNVNENEQNCTDMFRDAELPKRITNNESKSINEIIDCLKVKDSKVAIDYLDGIQQGDN